MRECCEQIHAETKLMSNSCLQNVGCGRYEWAEIVVFSVFRIRRVYIYISGTPSVERRITKYYAVVCGGTASAAGVCGFARCQRIWYWRAWANVRGNDRQLRVHDRTGGPVGGLAQHYVQSMRVARAGQWRV